MTPDADGLADPALVDARRQMVDHLRRRGITDAATLGALGVVPREAFVAARDRTDAYADHALSIGHGQSISQPYMVARMTQALRVADAGWPWTSHPPTLLDIGTGSGYQAAILAQLGAIVVSVERDTSLANDARQRLARLGYAVDILIGDGSAGAPDRGPFAGIIVGAAAPAIPSPLVDQLLDGARLVVPVGDRARQDLMVVQRRGGATRAETSDPCVFVPLRGAYGYPD